MTFLPIVERELRLKARRPRGAIMQIAFVFRRVEQPGIAAALVICQLNKPGSEARVKSGFGVGWKYCIRARDQGADGR